MVRKSIGRAAAIARYETHWWERASATEIATTQIQIRESICPFRIFHKALEEALGYQVFTHQFVDVDMLNRWFNQLTKGGQQ